MSESVKQSISYRIATQHVDLIAKHGLEAVMNAIDDQASFVGEVEEIGSSDISCWVNDVKRSLGEIVP